MRGKWVYGKGGRGKTHPAPTPSASTTNINIAEETKRIADIRVENAAKSGEEKVGLRIHSSTNLSSALKRHPSEWKHLRIVYVTYVDVTSTKAYYLRTFQNNTG